MRALILSLASFFCIQISEAQQKALNIPAIHQLVSDSKNEHERQSTARDRQAVNSINEEANRTLLARFKNRYRELQSHFNSIGTAIDLLDIGTRAAPMVSQIAKDQYSLYELAGKTPELLPFVLQTEIDLLEKSRNLLYYLAGLTASLGAVNQMKSSDRRILFDHIISELSNLRNLAVGLVQTFNYGNIFASIRKANPFSGYVEMDRAIVKDILQNAKYLKK
ncbi:MULTISPECIES: hypothetical protein [Pedobacter]|uniref:Uncharacterized protein n=1 Tax=Pedobacter suwonensis TaxID=332999 RepID=A0A1I0TT71_9SPHI|nr:MULTISPECIES: hypothetical protein [Pedobacter]SFA54979.1 hypothetical protein SAMN04488511_11456 [Pedobacter suwonensis]